MRTPRALFRKVLAALLGALLLGALAPAAVQAAAAPRIKATGLHISNGRLLESNGNDFVMRGVNHAHTWYPTRLNQSLADIKAFGANTVRVVLADGHRWTANTAADVGDVIAQCKANRVICVLEVHDTTGYGEESAAGTLDQAADYWINLKSVLAGQEDYIAINIGNEPWGNTNPDGWTAPTIAAVKKLRAAGLQHLLMVDAPNWGQDWQGVMRANAQSVYAADPTGNLIFSIHMYSVFDTAAEITDYLNAFVTAKLPLLIGEFGGPADQYGDPDEDTMMASAQQLKLGYLAWSWSGNTDPILDLALNFDAKNLSSWGQRIFNGPNGIVSTSKEATIFGGGGPGGDTQAPTAPGTPTASAVTGSSATLTWAASSDNVGVSAYDVVRVSGTTETAAAASTTNSATVTGLSASTAYTFAVYARDAAGNRSTRSGTVNVTTGPPAPGQSCAVGYRAVGEWSGGFQGEIVIKNTSTTVINGWTLGFSFADGQTVSNMWGGTATQSGGAVTVKPASYTATIPAAGSVTVGFIANKGATNSAPATFTLNGTTCAKS
ncbi:cellulase family glycosylhydrolase [Streptomyces acidiscabies]|uniref:Endoglucanase n=1 Tax=Streptomyces acidiscabies TaxID=42234 RepID=A0AAP6ECP1_9ACTN|nr:cellulase family glycosylhydrolase [Streptomyces acidiscabies]MDX2958353.1 cellulase family glycosylhydrolase [Streptomyces acidiscabies]MDX3018720.1 cellulase family glycosylhydrolase [Streptomyces acidiscabies]MDX3790977.1 cellulase family glycosylhydrolase [Streptomyces acidiscabies]